MPAVHNRRQTRLSFADLVDIRALSIRQPWAELILRRRKPFQVQQRVETIDEWLEAAKTSDHIATLISCRPRLRQIHSRFKSPRLDLSLDQSRNA